MQYILRKCVFDYRYFISPYDKRTLDFDDPRCSVLREKLAAVINRGIIDIWHKGQSRRKTDSTTYALLMDALES
ncbi:hypothetical protein KIN20_018097 [Parelaphostrongylus tenuis]|uniref:Uncharacterized protein n=1 Tax=Parelaphostrongylus tenuis TaxID=148309 RepID=A0AAD5MIY4_PARTN|nr:hypothetical protein KIN20_018097 [Parelaphostrongylus tenuis]